MALSPEQQERQEKLQYYQSHLGLVAAALGIIYGLYRLYPVIKKKLK